MTNSTRQRRKIIPYNPALKERAKELRKNMTVGEVLLWNELKRGKILGCDFDRQRPMLEYIVDFYCKDLVLAIEVDGESHRTRAERDQKRQSKLESYGVTFLRFNEADIRRDVGAAVQRIRHWISEHRCRQPATPTRTNIAETRTFPPWRGALSKRSASKGGVGRLALAARQQKAQPTLSINPKQLP